MPVGIHEWETQETHTFVWDGNNIVLEKVEFADGTTRTFEYFWGADKSGTEQGAGGVGGLLAVSIDGMFYFPCYDQIGNVVCYVSEGGDIAAQYVYDPYGNVIDQYGALADVFDVRFSTRYTDSETGLVSYKRRFYRPEHGRWLNRDPIEEDGGENLYAFCGNCAISKVDYLGMFELTLISDKTSDGDVLLWYLFGGLGNNIKSNMHSEADMIEAMESQILNENSLITVLNISGHGADGSGVQFAASDDLDLSDKNSRTRKSLANYLAPNAIIRIWSCDAASTYEKCAGLQSAADDLNTEIYAKTGEVTSGPDGGPIVQGANKIAAWIVGSSPSTWRVFKPKPLIQAYSYRPGPQAYKIMKKEIRLK